MLAKIIRNYAQYIESSIPGIRWHVGMLNEVNSFPCFSILRPNSADPQLTLQYIGADSTLATVRLLVRGYSYSDGEDSTASSDALARQLEEVTVAYSHETFASQELRYSIEDSYVLSLETDEGLMSPYGVCDLEIEMIYVQTK